MERAIPSRVRGTEITIPWTSTLPFPIRNLLRRWRGTLGMILGVGISLSIVMTLAVMGKATIEIYTLDFIRSGADLYVIQQGGTLIPILPSDTPGNIKQARNTISQIRGIPEVRSAIGVMNWSMEREQEGVRRRDEPTELFGVLGVDGDPAEIPGMLVLNSGRWVRRSGEIVIGPKIAREKHIGIGDLVRLNDRDFTVVGIGKLRGFGFGVDSLAYMDYRAFRDRAPVGDVFSTIAVDVTDEARARAEILALGSLAVNDRQDLIQQAEAANASGLALYYVFDGLALAIAALFVSTMLNNTVAQRRLEFATMRAIGIPSRTVLTTVGIEALTICLVGGIVAIPISLLLGWWINVAIAEPYGLETLFNPDAGSFLLVFGLALLLGVVAGLLPARRAIRVDPVEVLREA